MSDEILGLDLGTSSLKLVGLIPRKEGYEVTGVAITTNPLGRLQLGTKDDRVQLATAIRSLMTDIRRPKGKVRVGLAESQVFTRVIQVPVLSEAELASAIHWEAEQHIPVPIAEVQLDYTVLSRPEKGLREGTMDVLLVAAKRQVVDQFADLSEAAGLELSGIETGLLAVARALSGAGDPPTLLIHIGASSTDFAILANGKLSLTYSVPTAGASLTRSLEVDLGLTPTQAEQYKRTYGLSEQMLEGKVRTALLPVFRSMMSEARKAIDSFELAKRGQKIQRVLLSGGGALLPEIFGEVANSLGVSEVILGNPFYAMSVGEGVTLPAEFSVYSAAVGLARRQ